MGTLKCLDHHHPSLFKKVLFAGASAGALLSACCVCKVPIDYAKVKFLSAAADAKTRPFGPFNPKFDVEKYLYRSMEFLPVDAHIKASGRLFVSLTRLEDFKNVMVSHWDTREELIQTLLCSCFIPVFSGFNAPTFRGVKYIDGGYTNKQPIISNNTLTISPFSGEAIICPRNPISSQSKKEKTRKRVLIWGRYKMDLSLENLGRMYSSVMPPKPLNLVEYENLGYKDAYRFIQSKRS